MKRENVIIPAALQLAVDDVGWMDGRIPYWDNWQPNRTGMPRRHVLADYIVLNEIGRSIGMKINVMFVLGEWDRKNVLRRVPYATKYGEKWDCAPFLDVREAEKIRDYLNSCEYLEIGVHGLLHEAWDKDGTYLGGEFSLSEDFKPGAPKRPVPEWYMRSHLDAFFEIYKDWGFQQELRTFTCPGECVGAYDTEYFARTLRDYGIRYCHEGDAQPACFVKDGIISNTRKITLAPWEAYDINPAKLPAYDPENAGIISAHWPNFLRYDPDENLERLEAWKAFFERQAKIFGLMIAKDMDFAHHQLLYKNFAEVEECGGRIRIDFARVDEMLPGEPRYPLYISIKNSACPIVCEGGTLMEYEKQDGFTTYQIERTEGSVILL